MILGFFGKISFFNLGGAKNFGRVIWGGRTILDAAFGGGRTILESRFIFYLNYSVGIMVL